MAASSIHSIEIPRGFWAGGVAQKRVGPWERRGKRAEKREKREERSEKRETSTIKMRGSKDAMVRS